MHGKLTCILTGKQLDFSRMVCENCPANSINPGNALGCTDCSLQHYTHDLSDVNAVQHECVACVRGQIRQATSNFTRCEPCALHFFVSPRTQQCELCVPNPDLKCGGNDEIGNVYFDDCSSVDVLGRGCQCGCHVCELNDFQGIIKNFVVLPGCRAACDSGYKLQHQFSRLPPLVCTRTQDLFLQAEYSAHKNGQMKFSQRNSNDFTLKPCFEFFSLSLMQLSALLYIEPSSLSKNTSLDLIRVDNSLLASYITHSWELPNMDDSCVFRCISGYTLRPSLSSNIVECVKKSPVSCPLTAVATFNRVTSCTRSGQQ